MTLARHILLGSFSSQGGLGVAVGSGVIVDVDVIAGDSVIFDVGVIVGGVGCGIATDGVGVVVVV